jgi:hypothetical protein
LRRQSPIEMPDSVRQVRGDIVVVPSQRDLVSFAAR